MRLWTCKCGQEETMADELSKCSSCKATGLFQLTKVECHQCNGTKKFWYVDGYDYCSLCDDDGMVPA